MRHTQHKAIDQNQLLLDWTASTPQPAEKPIDEPKPLKAAEEPKLPAVSPLIQRLPWDFCTTFPEPLEGAVEAGRIYPEDAEPEALKALHDEHAREALSLLAALDVLLDARRRGIDPETGRPPRSPKQAENLKERFKYEPGQIEHSFDVVMDVYEEVFGNEATDAFRKYVRAKHAGIEVITDDPPAVPPLHRAVIQGVFGREEDGSPVNPSLEEIQSITEHAAEQLEEAATPEAQDTAVAKYAEDFGELAAHSLRHWVMSKDQETAQAIKYDPGHPWHYYAEGDNAAPLPVKEIIASEVSDNPFKLPKNPKQRRAKLQQILSNQEQQLATDIARYEELCEMGVDALSDYDRKIAHGGNDELAWATAVSLAFNHIRFGKGRVLWLTRQLSEPHLVLEPKQRPL